MPEPVYSMCQNSLMNLIGALMDYSALYQAQEFQFDCGLLLISPVYAVFWLFQDPYFHDVKASWKPAMEGIWIRIPGSGKLLLPGQA